jgi:monofunctional biosynthetic peptidoglycan transglycosylase
MEHFLTLSWYVQNDTVMGGRSSGELAVQSDRLSFSGNTNTNGGGFSSIRTETLSFDLSSATGIELQVVGDGRTYNWHFQTDAKYSGRAISYWAPFSTVAGQRQTINIAFEKFLPRFRGTALPGPPFDSSRISEMGLYIYDGRDGVFQIELLDVGVF